MPMKSNHHKGQLSPTTKTMSSCILYHCLVNWHFISRWKGYLTRLVIFFPFRLDGSFPGLRHTLCQWVPSWILWRRALQSPEFFLEVALFHYVWWIFCLALPGLSSHSLQSLAGSVLPVSWRESLLIAAVWAIWRLISSIFSFLEQHGLLLDAQYLQKSCII